LIEKSAEKLFDKNIDLLRKEGFDVHNSQKKEYSFEATVNSGKNSLKIQVYFGKKGIKTVLQGNKESNIYKKVSSVLFGDELFVTEEIKEPESYIGIDESGKGDYFGPLVIAGVYVKNDAKRSLLSIGVKDSKQLSDNQIKEVSVKIKEVLSTRSYNVVTINPEKYNELYKKIGNVNKLLAWGHARVLENLLSIVKTTTAISDKFGNESFIKNSLMSKGKEINLHQATKGERFTAVAAASILARDKFISWFEVQQKKLYTTLPKGASLLVEEAARKLRDSNGDEFISKIAKLHFKTTKKISQKRSES
jgi:ribonuclease HIII